MKKTVSLISILALLIVFYPLQQSLAKDTAVPAALPFAKNGLPGARIVFDADDFGSGADAVMFVRMPSPEDGILELGGETLREGDIVSSRDISEMVFIPFTENELEASFDYIPIKGSLAGPQATVSINLLSERCYAPAAADISVTVGKGIATPISLRAYDPDGDVEGYIILSKPKKGSLETIDGRTVFTCSKSGSYSFTYCAVDSRGNRSEPATVKVKVEKVSSELLYDDLSGTTLDYPAAILAKKDIYCGRTVGGVRLLEPEKALTRAEFTAMAMRAAGLEPTLSVSAEYGGDEYSGYIALAVESGIIIDPAVRGGESITLSEAAVILSRLFDSEDGDAYAACVNPSAPAWAADAAADMMALGALSGGEDMTASLTVGDAVGMLYPLLGK